MKGGSASVLTLRAGQAFVQPFPFNQIIMVEAALCTTLETAIEVASTIADEGLSVGNELFNSKESCSTAIVSLRLTRLRAFFRTPEGTLKVVEAVIDDGKKAYIITLSELKGIEEI